MKPLAGLARLEQLLTDSRGLSPISMGYDTARQEFEVREGTYKVGYGRTLNEAIGAL